MSSQIPQAPYDTNPNEINIHSALSSGCLFCRFIADSFASVCEAGGACDPLIEKVLGVFSVTTKEEVNRAIIASINSRVPALSWRAGSTSLVRESFSEVFTQFITRATNHIYLPSRCSPTEWGSCPQLTLRGAEARRLRANSLSRWKKKQLGCSPAKDGI